MEELHQKVEALSWLQSNLNTSPLAGNRFDKEEAIDFVQTLYRLGCTKVYVTNIYDEESRIRDNGGPYADTLIAELPQDRHKKREIFAIYRQEERLDDFESQFENEVDYDYEETELRFWWD